MGALDGRVAIITGAGRGLGREHALLFASEGAKVVVNDLGGDMHGEGGDPSAAMQVVDEIKAAGGEAVVNGENVADWDGAQRLVQQAIDAFGDLHVLVNNAGILRDRVIINMTEAEWDSVDHRAPEGPLRADAPRRRLLAGADQGGQGGERVDHPHDLDVGTVLEPGAGELRRGQERDRDALAGLRQGVGALRRAVERDRARRPHAAHRGDAGARRRGQGARRGIRRVAPGQRLAVRRVPRDRGLPDHGRVLHGAGRQGAARRSRGRPRRSSRRTNAGRWSSSRPKPRASCRKSRRR